MIHLSSPSHTKWSVNLTHASVQNVLAISKRTPSGGSGKDQAQKLNITMNIKEALITYRPCTQVAFRLIGYSVMHKDMHYMQQHEGNEGLDV
jgi:hypothetical protein